MRHRGKLSLSDDLLQHEDLSCQPSPAAGELCDTLEPHVSRQQPFILQELTLSNSIKTALYFETMGYKGLLSIE